MSRAVSTTLSDAMIDAIRILAIEDGRAVGNVSGISSELRKAVRYRLTQYRFPAEIIDLSDREYRRWKAEHPQGLYGVRKGK